MIRRFFAQLVLGTVLLAVGLTGISEAALLRFSFEAYDDNEELISGRVLFPLENPNATTIDGPASWEIYFERWDATWISAPDATGFLGIDPKQPYDPDADPPWFQEGFGVFLRDAAGSLEIEVRHFSPDFPGCGMFGNRVADLVNYPTGGLGYCGEGDPFYLAYQWDGRSHNPFLSGNPQNLDLDSLQFQIVPEPGVTLLAVLAAGSYAVRRRRHDIRR